MWQFVDNLKSDKAFFFYRGSTALYALLQSMGVGQGDEVITPVFTCPAVPSPVVRLGARPVYVDILPTTFNLDPNQIEAKITPKTKVIIAQHTFGIPAEMDSILTIARSHGLWVIEDACHALGSRYQGQEVGALGDAAIYSFGWYKPVVLGSGGAAVVNRPDLEARLQETYAGFVTPAPGQAFTLYAQYAVYRLLLSPVLFWPMKEAYRRLRDFKSGPRKGKIGPLLFGGSTPGAASVEESSVQANRDLVAQPVRGRRMIPWQQQRLLRKLGGWHSMVERQTWIVSRYQELLAQAGYAPLQLDGHLKPVYYKYPVLSDRKREIFEQAQKIKVEMSDMFGSPLHPAERAANWRALGYQQGMCPISESVSDRIVALPVHAGVTAQSIEKTVAFLANFN